MVSISHSFWDTLRVNRLLLLLGNLLAGIVLIILQNRGLLPLDMVSFVFFSFVMLLFALYRPGWAFLLFVGVLPFEAINLMPALFGSIMLRPYQWLCVIILLSVAIRFFSGTLPFRLFRPRLFDALPLLLSVGAFLALLGAPVPGIALKQALVVSSFVAVYFLGRIFFRTLYDVRQALPFFLVSSAVVCCYALWQNIRFLAGQESFQVMAGRPNAAFSEADWLGLFTLIVLGTLFSLTLSWWGRFGGRKLWWQWLAPLSLLLMLVLVESVLIISVARSAWLGALALFGVFCLGALFSSGARAWRQGFRKMLPFGVTIGATVLVAMGSVLLFHLSPFQFLNRIQSTGSGLQNITVACEADVALPERIEDVSELISFGCRHIDLEAIETEEAAGKFVKTTARPDPNVSVRQEIYRTVFGVIREHPVWGIGFGSIASFLGTDARGAGLNASNVFLEVWLGSGILGLLAFSFWWLLCLSAAFVWYRQTTDVTEQAYALFLLATFLAVTVFDLFNSGLLLGFLFVLLSLGALALERSSPLSQTQTE